MLRVLLPTTLATNKIAASWVNTNFRLGKITGVGTPYTEVTSLAAKQVCFGPVKAQHVQILLQNVELFSTLCNNYSQPAATWFVARTLASFSLQRLWFRAQIGGTRKAPLVARKTNSGMKVPPIQCANVVSCWSICLVSSLPRLSLCLLLFGKCSSKTKRPCCTACFQAERSEAKVSHPLMSMPKAFRSLSQTSIKRSWGLTVRRFPWANSP